MTAYRDRRNRTWRYDVMVGGRRYTARGFPTKQAATAAGEKRREAVLQGRSVDSWTFTQLVDSFLIESSRTKSAAWTYQLKMKLNAGFGHLADVPIVDLKPINFLTALNELTTNGRKPRTVNEYRKIVHSVMQYAVRIEALSRNPIAMVARVPEDAVEVDPIPLAHLQSLILAADVETAALLMFLSQTAARWIEAARLLWTEVFVDHKPPFCILTTRKQHGGGERKEPQPLTRLALDAIDRMRGRHSSAYVFPSPSGDQMAYGTALKRLQRLCETLKLPEYSFHQIRHYAGFVATNMGGNRKAVSIFLRQTSVGATDRYMHAIDPQIWKIAAELERDMGGIAITDDDSKEVSGE